MTPEGIEFIRSLTTIGTVVSYDKQLMKDDGLLIVKATINGSDEDVLIWDNWGEAGLPYIIGSEVVAFSALGLAEIKFGFIRNALYAPPNLKEGEKVVYNKDVQIYLNNEGTLNITTSKDCNITSSGSVNIVAATNITGDVDIVGNTNISGVYKVDAVQVIGNRGAAVTAPTGGVTIDAEARTAINAIISRLSAHGLIS